MTLPFTFLSHQLAHSSDSREGSPSIPDNRNHELNTGRTFQEFYHRATTEPASYQNPQEDPFALYIAKQNNSLYEDLSQQTGEAAARIYDVSASSGGMQNETGPLELLRQDLEQNYQETAYELGQQNSSNYAGYTENLAEVQNHKISGEPTKGSGSKDKILSSADMSPTEERGSTKKNSQPSSQVEASQSSKREEKVLIQKNQKEKQTNAPATISSEEAIQKIAPNRSLLNPGPISKQQRLLSLKTPLGDRVNSENLAVSDGKENTSDGHKKNKIKVIDERSIVEKESAYRLAGNEKNKLRPSEERLSAQKTVEESSDKYSFVKKNDIQLSHNESNSNPKKIHKPREVSTNALLQNPQEKGRPLNEHLAAQERIAAGSKLLPSESDILQSNVHIKELSLELAENITGDTTEIMERKLKLTRRLGRVAELRKQQNSGVQQLSVGENQRNPSVGQQQNRRYGGFDFSQNFHDRGGDNPALGDVQQNSFPNSSTTSTGFRSIAQQMFQRLQEGPLAQNIRQLQFRLLDQNRGEIRLHMKPENLGQVRIHLSIEGSQLSGRILAENMEAARILQDNMQHLEASLRAGGFDSQGLNVSIGGDQAGSTDSRESTSGSNYTKLSPVDAEIEEEANFNERTLLYEKSQINFSA